MVHFCPRWSNVSVWIGSFDLAGNFMNERFFTSDEHFGHVNILKFCNRPWNTVEEMTEGLIENFNKWVPKGSVVYHLGDMFWKMDTQSALNVMDRLNGQHYLIKGNHDYSNYLKQIAHKFVWIKDYEVISVDKQPIALFHYPMKTWYRKEHGGWHLFGHVHGKSEFGIRMENGNSMDVGVDAWNYRPVSFDEIKYQFRRLEQGE